MRAKLPLRTNPASRLSTPNFDPPKPTHISEWEAFIVQMPNSGFAGGRREDGINGLSRVRRRLGRP